MPLLASAAVHTATNFARVLALAPGLAVRRQIALPPLSLGRRFCLAALPCGRVPLPSRSESLVAFLVSPCEQMRLFLEPQVLFPCGHIRVPGPSSPRCLMHLEDLRQSLAERDARPEPKVNAGSPTSVVRRVDLPTAGRGSR